MKKYDSQTVCKVIGSILATTLISSSGHTETSRLSISTEELVKFQYLIQSMDLPMETVIQKNIESGKIIIDENNQIKINSSVYDLLKDKMGNREAMQSVICARTGSGN